ncbi:hypothetical protein SNEBB_001596 [Seison nebaliae]|nr:hypothetical protein SNEBB_001596 [Seison nebaliae]
MTNKTVLPEHLKNRLNHHQITDKNLRSSKLELDEILSKLEERIKILLEKKPTDLSNDEVNEVLVSWGNISNNTTITNYQKNRLQTLVKELEKTNIESPQDNIFKFSRKAKNTRKKKREYTENICKSIVENEKIEFMENAEDDILTISKKENEDIKLTNYVAERKRYYNRINIFDIDNCRLSINYQLSLDNTPMAMIRLNDVKNCERIIISPIQGSLMITNCENCEIIGAAQQIRIHSSNNLRLHVHVSSQSIMEDSVNLSFYDYWKKVENNKIR